MTWKQESKEITESMYGGYCEMCRKLNIEILPYHKFTILEYERVKTLAKEDKESREVTY